MWPTTQPLTIQLTDDEQIIFAGDYLTPDGLKAALLREAADHQARIPTKKISDVTVIIRADRFAKTGKVQEIIQTVPGSGVRHVRPPRQTERHVDAGGTVSNHRDTEVTENGRFERSSIRFQFTTPVFARAL